MIEKVQISMRIHWKVEIERFYASLRTGKTFTCLCVCIFVFPSEYISMPMYEQDALPPKEMDPAEKHCKQADIVLCLGTR